MKFFTKRGKPKVHYSIGRHLLRLERIMTDRFDSIDTAIVNVNANLASAKEQLTLLAGQVAALGTGVTQAELDAKAAEIQSIADNLGTLSTDIDAIIEPDAGESSAIDSPGDVGEILPSNDSPFTGSTTDEVVIPDEGTTGDTSTEVPASDTEVVEPEVQGNPGFQD